MLQFAEARRTAFLFWLWLIRFLHRSGPGPYYEEQMKFMVSGYGSETGTAQKPFRTIRLRSKPEQPVQVVKNSVSYPTAGIGRQTH